MFHTLFPYEIKMSCIDVASMSDIINQIEIASGRCLNINKKLTTTQQDSLTTLLQTHKQTSAWDYTEMKELDLKLCTHKIFIKEDNRPMRQP